MDDKKFNVSVGQRFCRLLVLELIQDRKNPKAMCICDCGVVVTPQRGALKNGRAKSCGCLRAEQNRTVNLTHGKSKTVEYKIFTGIKDRCRNVNNPHFKNYGGRGICLLYENFDKFIRDVGARPRGAWIERLDNEKSYGPGNCAWVSPSVNQINKRVSKLWTINGTEYESSIAAANELGVTPSVIIRGCNGYTRSGRYFPAREGWSCALKYAGELA